MTAIQQLLPRTKTSKLRDQIKRQSELLDADFKRVKTQSSALRQSVVHSALSPLGLCATAAAGFVSGRRLFRKRRPLPQATEPIETAATTKPTWWLLELLVPIAFTWIRETVVAHLQSNRQPPPPPQ